MSCKKQNNKKCKNYTSLDDLIDDYIKNYRPAHQTELTNCNSLSESVWGKDFSLFSSVAIADKDHPSSTEWNDIEKSITIHTHQAVIGKKYCRKVGECLCKHFNTSRRFNTFEELYDYVKSILTNPFNGNAPVVKGEDCLIIYDIAKRLAKRFAADPDAYIYLNGSGPKTAIKDLIPNYRGSTIPRKVLISSYPSLGRLSSADIEDFLCIYKNEIIDLKKRNMIP